MITIVAAGMLWHRCTPKMHTACGLGLLKWVFEITLAMELPEEALTVARGIAAEMNPETVDCEPCSACFVLKSSQ